MTCIHFFDLLSSFLINVSTREITKKASSVPPSNKPWLRSPSATRDGHLHGLVSSLLEHSSQKMGDCRISVSITQKCQKKIFVQLPVAPGESWEVRCPHFALCKPCLAPFSLSQISPGSSLESRLSVNRSPSRAGRKQSCG